MEKGAIGVFDSGIGGLTVIKELLLRLPGESFVYFGDTAHVPYGNKSRETVLRFSRENVAFLIERGVKLVVVACNTASAEALPDLQRELPIPVVGVIEPGIRAALRVSKNLRIGVIGTAGTIRSCAYQDGIKNLKGEAEVYACACPLFVPLAEEGWVDGEATEIIAKKYLSVYHGKGIDTLVLGCTHYPLLRDVIARVMGDGVVLVDSAVETAREVVDLVKRKHMLRKEGKGDLMIYLSDIAPSFREVGERFLGKRIEQIKHLSL